MGLLASVLVSALCGACGLTQFNQMKLPTGAATAEPLEVVGYSRGSRSTLNQGLRLGAYSVRGVSRSRSTERRGSGLLLHRLSTTTEYSFVVAAAGQEVVARCVVSAESLQNSHGGRPVQGLTCEFEQGGAALATLELQSSSQSAALRGRAALADLTVAFTPVTARERGPASPDALGYEVLSAGQVGALEVSGHGRAFLPAGLTEAQRLGLVASYGAILLYRPPEPG